MVQSEVEARNECLKTFNLRDSMQAESSKYGEMASQQAKMIKHQAELIVKMEKEVKDLKKCMGSFIQGEESLKSIMKNTKSPLEREGLGMTSTSKDKTINYEGRNGIPYNYAMPQKICNKCG